MWHREKDMGIDLLPNEGHAEACLPTEDCLEETGLFFTAEEE
jgi:hypothetical protein